MQVHNSEGLLGLNRLPDMCYLRHDGSWLIADVRTNASCHAGMNIGINET